MSLLSSKLDYLRDEVSEIREIALAGRQCDSELVPVELTPFSTKEEFTEFDKQGI